MSLVGNLRDMELTSLIQFICIQKRRIGLSLKNGSDRGYIVFENGNIVHAETGGIEGEDAILRLLDWEDGHFTTKEIEEITHRSINMPWDRLLMEAMVKLDESGDFEDEFEFEEKRELTEQEITEDSILEDRMMLLLAQLEQEQSQIKFGKLRGAIQILGALVNMANTVLISFETIASKRSNEASLKKECTRYISRYPMARWLLTPEGHLSNKSALELLQHADSVQRQQVFADVCLSIIGVMDSTFKVIASCFYSKDCSTEITEAYNLFLSDLNDTVGDIKI